MEDDFPRSESDAREHIRHIRREKGLGDGNDQIGSNASDLQSALNVLSHDLYQTTTHFLLELIQNADDNTYADGVTPTLSISYASRRIRIDCNERGFTKKNVEAICRICKSTKSGKAKTSGFVGEKGIGFKAVFKVAKRVWISSGHYSFSFNRDGHLGMIAPIWDEFPGKNHLARRTSMILELDDSSDENSILDELRKYDPKILMFLRRLRKIEIDVKVPFWTLSRDFKTSLVRQDRALTTSADMLMLYNNGVKSSYLVWRHTTANMPKDARRPGIGESELVLGFPLSQDESEPIVEAQHVYAFLPVKPIGLNFLLQGDFLLTANRGEFHMDSDWNKALANASATAFVDAMNFMSRQSSDLRFKWLRFVPDKSVLLPTIFHELAQEVTRQLSKADVLVTRKGSFRKPKDTTYFPARFRDRKGQPLISNDSDSDLHPSYNLESQTKALASMGVKCIDEWTFSKEVVSHLDGKFNHQRFYAGRDNSWCIDFAQALNGLGVHFWGFTARKLYIIPLSDGTWGRPQDPTVFRMTFPDDPPHMREARSVAFPLGFDLKMVDPQALLNPQMKALVIKAQVTPLQTKTVQDMILQGHEGKANGPDFHFKVKSQSIQQLVSQAVYLFRTEWTNVYKSQKFYVATAKGSTVDGSGVYMPSDKPSSASKVLEPGRFKALKMSRKYKYLHSAYLTAVSKEEIPSWLLFLQEELLVATYPRITRNKVLDSQATVPQLNRYMHGDFLDLMLVAPSDEWLTVLRDGWDDWYCHWLTTGTSVAGIAKKEHIVPHLRTQKVSCRGSHPPLSLDRVFQPSQPLVDTYGDLAPLIALPDPEHSSWTPLLNALKVPSEENTEFFAACMRSARRAGDSLPMSKIDRVIQRMDEKREVDSLVIDKTQTSSAIGVAERNSFRSLFRQKDDPLICIPPKEKGGQRLWVSADECFWEGESWFTSVHRLSDIYPDYEFFFRRHVMVPNITAQHYIDEMPHVKNWSNHSTARIERLLLGLAKHHAKEDLSSHQIEVIRSHYIWPISDSARHGVFDRLAQASTDKWAIADRAFFREVFDTAMPMLSLSPDMVHRLMPLFEDLGLQRKMLSRNASNVVKADGEVALHEGLTEKYRSRTSYLVRLMPKLQHDRDHVRSKFGNVEVYLTSSIVQYWNASSGVGRVTSKPIDGVAFLESDYTGSLRVYMKTGYDAEPFPIELADRLTEFFNVPISKKDLVNVVLTANIERLDRIFDEKGIPPLVDLDDARPAADYDDPPGFDASSSRAHIESSGERVPVSDLGSSQTSRLGRLLGHRRFASSPSNDLPQPFNQSVSSLPSYNAAVGNRPPSTKAVGKRTSLASLREKSESVTPMIYTWDGAKNTMMEVMVDATEGMVKVKLPEPNGFLDKVKTFLQRDAEAAELIGCEVLASIIGKSSRDLYRNNNVIHGLNAKDGRGTCNFLDSHGKFSTFLQRLEGAPGRGQGYDRFTYLVDIMAATSLSNHAWNFNISEAELGRFRRYSAKALKAMSTGDDDKAPVSVLVVIADPRKNPKMLFLPDPWELYQDGSIDLRASGQGVYSASLAYSRYPNAYGSKTYVPQRQATTAGAESGFDAVQIRVHGKATWVPGPPSDLPEKGRDMERIDED